MKDDFIGCLVDALISILAGVVVAALLWASISAISSIGR